MSRSDIVLWLFVAVDIALAAGWTWWCWWGSKGDYPAGWP